MNRQTILSLVLVFVLCFSASGCAPLAIGAVAGGGAYTYVSGWVDRSYNVDLDQAYDACLAGAGRLGVSISKQERHLSSAYVKGTDGDSTVWINLESQSPKVTLISVRVGLLGDKPASRRIHEAIARKM